MPKSRSQAPAQSVREFPYGICGCFEPFWQAHYERFVEVASGHMAGLPDRRSLTDGALAEFKKRLESRGLDYKLGGATFNGDPNELVPWVIRALEECCLEYRSDRVGALDGVIKSEVSGVARHHRLPTHMSPEDLAQDIWVKICNGSTPPDSQNDNAPNSADRSRGTYSRTAIRNRLIDLSRVKGNHPHPSLAEDPINPKIGLDLVSSEVDLKDSVNRALKQLKPTHREAILDHFFHYRSAEETAKRLGLRVPQIYRIRKFALASLQILLRPEDPCHD